MMTVIDRSIDQSISQAIHGMQIGWCHYQKRIKKLEFVIDHSPNFMQSVINIDVLYSFSQFDNMEWSADVCLNGTTSGVDV